MSNWLLLLVGLWPLLLVATAGIRQGRWWLVTGPLPALAAGLVLAPGVEVELPWLLIGIELGLDATGRGFLLVSAVLWLLAALYAAASLRADAHALRFRVFFLLAMAGNLGLITAQDLVGFYLGFALMGLSAAGLIAHDGSPAGRRAGRVYLGWTMLGEVALFSGVITLAQVAGGIGFAQVQASDPPTLAFVLVALGLGIKLALPGLHVWMPLAYPAAPTAAAIALSGAMINAGVLGWLRFLPLAGGGEPSWGLALAVIGLIGAFYGVAIGLTQRAPRVILAYSSLSQMGVLTAAAGIALARPELAGPALAAMTLYAAHHALVKGALFLGVGLLEEDGARRWVLPGLIVLALSLAGAPFTSGAVAKYGLKPLGAESGWAWVPWLLVASSVATTVLMSRFVAVVLAERPIPGAQPLPVARLAWGIALALVIAFPFVFGGIGALLSGALPVLGGVLVAGLVLLTRSRVLAGWIGRIPPGDLIALPHHTTRLGRGVRQVGPVAGAVGGALVAAVRALAGQRPRFDLDTALLQWSLAGIAWLAIVGLLLLGLLRGP